MATVKMRALAGYTADGGIVIAGGFHPDPDALARAEARFIHMSDMPHIIGSQWIDLEVPAWNPPTPLSTLPPEAASAELATASAAHVDPLGR